MKKLQKILLPALLLSPLVAAAQNFPGISSCLSSIRTLVSTATTIVAGLALLVFFWGLVKFINNAGSEDAKEEGRRLMIWGIVALFVMVSVWGLVNIMTGTFQTTNTGPILPDAGVQVGP